MSIVRYFTTEKTADEGALRRFISLLLSAIENQMFEGDHADYDQFRTIIKEVAGRFSANTTEQEMLIMAGTVSTACKDYAERTSRFIRAQSVELRQMVSMLTAAITSSVETSQTSLMRLQNVEEQLRGAVLIEDILTVRGKLEQCLEAIREEIVQKQQLLASAAAELQRVGCEAHSEVPGALVDSVTGLCGRPRAEAALKEAHQSGKQYYVVVVVANCIDVINSKFGDAAADCVLRSLCTQLQTLARNDDRVFRWTGPAYIALLQRDAPIHHLRNEVQRIADKKSLQPFEVDSRCVLLPRSAKWAVLPISGRFHDVVAALDQLVASG